jgi:hypothetical protein
MFIGDVKERRLSIALSLAEGTATNIDTYHRLVGMYQGLGEALAMFEQLLEQDNF